MKSRIPYTKPSITTLETEYTADAAANGWGDRCYDYIDRFEVEFAAHIGTKFAIATSSCTGALHMGMAALGIGQGDEVILADTNWIASVAPIVHLGAKPVFVDIRPDSWCIDPSLIESAITRRTKAILAVHLYGNLCEMKEILAIGERLGIPVIEDAAEAIGSEYFGKRAGQMGAFGAFSFHGTKTISTGEGGMFVTDDLRLHARMLTMSNHGRRKGELRQFWPSEIGFKYKMSNIQAALGCAQLQRCGELVQRKREILRFYRDELVCIDGVQMNPEPANTINGAWMPTVVFDKDLSITREILLSAFKDENIDARVFFHPLSSLTMFSDASHNRHAWEIPGRAINLPSFHDISSDQLGRVVSVVKKVIRKKQN